jgi:hypothetical protein
MSVRTVTRDLKVVAEGERGSLTIFSASSDVEQILQRWAEYSKYSYSSTIFLVLVLVLVLESFVLVLVLVLEG